LGFNVLGSEGASGRLLPAGAAVQHWVYQLQLQQHLMNCFVPWVTVGDSDVVALKLLPPTCVHCSFLWFLLHVHADIVYLAVHAMLLAYDRCSLLSS
jgi:hypothetical protein